VFDMAERPAMLVREALDHVIQAVKTETKNLAQIKRKKLPCFLEPGIRGPCYNTSTWRPLGHTRSIRSIGIYL
jgi:hypothetical protein